MAKCPECGGNNAFEIIPDEDIYEDESDDIIEMECDDCGYKWDESIEEAIDAFYAAQGLDDGGDGNEVL